MPWIEIISVPEGGAPDHIRRAWLGIKLPAEGPAHRKVGWFGKPWLVLDREAYIVDFDQAMLGLDARYETEAQDWFENLVPQPKVLCFNRSECRELKVDWPLRSPGQIRNPKELRSK